MRRRASRVCLPSRRDWVARRGFPPLQRAEIVALACLEPIAKGLCITHWSSSDLARQSFADEIVETISPRTVRRILDTVDLHPHRTRYWKTSRLDTEFRQRAEKILWCYAHAERLREQGILVVCADEIPNFQVLERFPIRRAQPGMIEHQEFEYTRHGTVNLLLFLIVEDGKMQLCIEPRKDGPHYVAALKRFRRRYRSAKGAFLIHDNDPSHTAALTQDYLHSDGWWRPRPTPAHASWLNQAELLIGAFSSRYLKRSSWTGPSELIDHVRASEAEYNRRYAHPFEWTWTSAKMRQWFEKHHS